MDNFYIDSAAIVDAIGRPDFSDVMIEACQSVVNFDSAIILAFDSDSNRPFCLATHYARPEIEFANELYFNKYFKNCEVLERLQEKRGSDNISLIRQSAQDIVDPDYRRDLYEMPLIAYDLMLLALDGPMYFTLELFRQTEAEPFSEEDERRVRDFWPLLLACLQKNVRLSKLPKFTLSRRSEQLKSLIELFLDKGVSNREAEVCGHIALGYSTLATSLHLSISVNTVSTLRQRAYKKLEISCMNELYSLCLQSFGTMLGEEADLSREYFED